MGNDGGDIPKRSQLVKKRTKVQRPNMQSVAMGRSRFCNLTSQKLKEPLAIDRLGCIYNYENIIEALLKKSLPQKYAYIKKISDIKKTVIQKTSTDSNNYIVCPITKLQYNGFNKFIGLWTCGHILSRKAFKQINSQTKTCMVCEVPYEDKDVIDLNLQGEQLEIQRRVLIEKKKKLPKETQTHKNGKQTEQLGKPSKKIKTDAHINTIDRLGGEFRDVLRERQQFKGIFYRPTIEEWTINTFTAEKKT